MQLKWFESYLKNRNQQSFFNGQASSFKHIICRVPQGSILGPLLVLLYINYMPDCLNSTTRVYMQMTLKSSRFYPTPQSLLQI